MQPYHAIDDGRWAQKRIGPERIKTTYAFRSLLDSGGQTGVWLGLDGCTLDPILGYLRCGDPAYAGRQEP